MDTKNTITFEVGDVAECHYYKFRGKIKEFRQDNGIDYVVLRNSKGDLCTTRLVIKSGNSPIPFYLQLICKRQCIPNILVEALKY